MLGTGLYVHQVEPRWIVYEERTLPLQGLPANLVGKRLVQLSDLHMGFRVTDGYLKKQFEYVNSLQPDFVVYTGDFIDQATEDHLAKFEQFENDLPLGRLGTLGVLGNHDYDRSTRRVDFALKLAAKLQDAGITILMDESTAIAGLTFAGLEDFWSPRFQEGSIREVIQSLPQGSIVLSHNPDTVDLPIWQGFHSWVLCGHTHGGQCRVPGFAPPFIPVRNKNYVAGTYELPGDFRMYINRGVGHTMKVRFCVRPEITIFTLESA